MAISRTRCSRSTWGRSSSLSGRGGGTLPPPPRGFTLLELTLVVAILAIVATSVVFVSGGLGSGVQERTSTALARAELAELRRAVLRFRADTGYLPRRGPFDLVPPYGSGSLGTVDPSVAAHWPTDAPAAAADRVLWFQAPANWYQLLVRADSPAEAALLADAWATITGDPDVPFDPDTGRGYRGPYLTVHGEGRTYVGASLAPDGDGDPGQGSLVGPMPAVADPFQQLFVEPPAPFAWIPNTLAAGETAAGLALGRPYLLVVRGAPDDLPPRIVCLGANGVYESDTTAIGGDDLAVFLQ